MPTKVLDLTIDFIELPDGRRVKIDAERGGRVRATLLYGYVPAGTDPDVWATLECFALPDGTKQRSTS